MLQLNFDEIIAVAGMVGDGWQSCPRNPALEVVVESDAVLPGHDDHQILRVGPFHQVISEQINICKTLVQVPVGKKDGNESGGGDKTKKCDMEAALQKRTAELETGCGKSHQRQEIPGLCRQPGIPQKADKAGQGRQQCCPGIKWQVVAQNFIFRFSQVFTQHHTAMYDHCQHEPPPNPGIILPGKSNGDFKVVPYGL